MRRAVGWLLLVVVGLLLGGCQLKTDLTVSVDDDGSGVVVLAVGVDDEGLARRPDLFEELAVDDLVGTGWELSGPFREDDGFTRLRVRHTFDDPGQITALVADIAGDDGPFRDFSVVRQDAFASSRYRFTGTVDFTGGVAAALDDDALSEALDADPVALLEDELGAAIDSLVTVRVGVRLPGAVTSNAPAGATRAGNGAIWQPSVLEHEAVVLTATGTVQRPARWVWAGLAAAAGVGFILFLLVRIALWRRRRLDVRD